MTKTFPTLYKKTSTGKDQQWTISVDGNVITTEFGQVGGKIQTATDVVREGKNVGKKNETTPAEQALLEAEATWTKKLKKDYVRSLDAAQNGEVSDLIAGGILPMLAVQFEKRGHKLTYPCALQPKFNGHRCIGEATPDVAHLWSRTRKPIELKHVTDAIAEAIRDHVNLDGELYNHELREHLNQLTHWIHEGDGRVEYHIYDLAIPDQSFLERWQTLEGYFRVIPASSPLKLAETIIVNDEAELLEAFRHFRNRGFEGAIARNLNGLYKNKRTDDLQKVKEWIDEEFDVVDVEEGRGKLAGHAIFVCQTKAGKRFNAKMKGPLAKLKEIYESRADYIGRFVTVKFAQYTDDGLPFHGVALGLREDL